MSKWQCSEETARAVESAAWLSEGRTEAISAVRAAITAAVGEEVDALREALADVVVALSDMERGTLCGNVHVSVRLTDNGAGALKNARAVLAKTGGS